MAARPQRSGNPVPTYDDTGEETLGDRISVAVRRLGGLTEAGRIVGVTDETVGRWSKNETKAPFQACVDLCAAAKISVNWLATGQGPRDIEAANDLTQVSSEQRGEGDAMLRDRSMPRQNIGMIMLPQLSIEASAGSGLIPISEEVEGFVSFRESYLKEIGVDPRHAHVLRVSGRSMAPTINDRDIVIVDTSARAIVSEGLYTLVYGEAVLVKRIQMLRDGGVNIVSDNKSEGYRDEFIPRSELASLRIVGRVKGHFRAL